jgi:biotin carboxyl carrier protein
MKSNNWKIDGKSEVVSSGATVKWTDDTFFKIHHQGKTFLGEIIEEKLEERTLKVKVNHREFTIYKEGSLDQLIEELGLNKPIVRKLQVLKAPMPGRVVLITVEVGQEVEVGSALLTLEAMKMENVLKSEGIGTVKSIDVTPDTVVDKGAVLISFE